MKAQTMENLQKEKTGNYFIDRLVDLGFSEALNKSLSPFEIKDAVDGFYKNNLGNCRATVQCFFPEEYASVEKYEDDFCNQLIFKTLSDVRSGMSKG